MRNLTKFDLRTRRYKKICTLMGSIWRKCIIFGLGKYRRVMFDGIQSRLIQILKENWLVVSKKMTNLENFHKSPWKSQNWGFMASLCPSLKMCELRICREIMCHDNEEWCKNWRGIDLPVQNWDQEFHKFWLEQLKISKICILMDCFWPKYIMLELNKYRTAIFDSAEYWSKTWRKTNFCFQKLHEWFSNFHQGTFESLKIRTFIESFYSK